MRIITGKCAISQTGSGSGYWQVSITGFNDPAGQYDTTELAANDMVCFTDSGTFYNLEITEVVSAAGSSAVVKVSNVGVTGISSVPTTSNACVSRGSVNYNFIPWVANVSGNENQLFMEYVMDAIDTAIDSVVTSGGATNLTFTGAGPYTLNSSTGTDVTFTQGSGIVLTRTGNDLTIAASGGGGGATDLTFTGSASPYTLNSSTGTDVLFAQGNGITLTRSTNTLTIASNSSVTNVLDLINGIDIALSGTNITVAPNIPELTTLSTYDANDQIMIYDNSASSHKKGTMSGYLSNGFVDKVSTQVDIAGEKGFTTALHYGAASLPTGSAFGSSSATIFALKGVTTMTQSNYSTLAGMTIHTAVDGVNNYSSYITATGDSTSPAKSGSIVLRVSSGATPFVDALKINPAGRVMTMRGTGVTGSSGGDIIVGSSGLGFESGPVDYVFKTTSSSGQEFVLLESGGTKCYTGVGSSQWTFPSDARLKQNIQELSVLDKIHLLKGVTYELKTDSIAQVGVIAQDIQSAFPEGVRQDENGYLGVGAMTVAAIALQGLKELHAEYIKLKNDFDALKGQVETMTK